MTQKKDTPRKAKSSTMRDPLAPYKEQARTFINLYFGNSTPEFVRDLLKQWYTELESTTQVFWNDKSIAEIALPLMLKKAAAMGVDVENMRTDFMTDVVGTWESFNTPRGGHDEETDQPSGRGVLQSELEKDAIALARILNSPYVPFRVKAALSDEIAEHTARFTHHPAVLKVAYSLGISEYQAEHAEGGAE